MTELTLDEWLSKIYKADIRLKSGAALASFAEALGANAELRAAAVSRLQDLEAMIGERGERACAYSTKYRNYLSTVLA